MNSVLSVESLDYSYDGFVSVLADVTFGVAPGSVTGLVGPNGSGKSTLIKVVSDLLELQSGAVRIGGQQHSAPAAKSQAIYLASNDHLPEFLTPDEYYAMLARLYRLPFDREAAESYFSVFGMTGRLDHLIEDFSHGMRKKTQLVAAFLFRRPLTVIDETLNGIDLDALLATEQEIARLRSEGVAVVVCSHDFAFLERVADRILFLQDGELALDESLSAITLEHGSLADMVFGRLGPEGR